MQGRALSIPTRRTCRASLPAWLAAALVFCASAALAQEPAPAAEPASKPEEEKAPQAIPIPEIAIRSEQVTTLLRTIETGLEKDPASTERRSSGMWERSALLAETNSLLEQSPRQRVLEAVADSWRSARIAMETRNATLTERVSALEPQIQQLAGSRETWQRTGDEAAAAKVPESVRERVQTTIAASFEPAKVERRRLLREPGQSVTG